MLGKNFPFHLTAHSNTLAASSWVLELILPQIYFRMFQVPSQVSFHTSFFNLLLLFYVLCCVEKWWDIEENPLTLDSWHNLFNCIWYRCFFYPRNSPSLFAFENLAPGNKFVSIVNAFCFQKEMELDWYCCCHSFSKEYCVLFH